MIHIMDQPHLELRLYLQPCPSYAGMKEMLVLCVWNMWNSDSFRKSR